MSPRAHNTLGKFSSLMALISNAHQNTKWSHWSKQANSDFGAFLGKDLAWIRPALMALSPDI